jgi:hypothetical protein
MVAFQSDRKFAKLLDLHAYVVDQLARSLGSP